MFQYEFWQWESVLTPEECQAILDKNFHSQKKIFAEVTGGNTKQNSDGTTSMVGEVVDKIRKTEIVWAFDQQLSNLMINHMHSANVQAGWFINAGPLSDVQIGRYADGGHYDWHIDATKPGPEGLQRKLSISVLLSDHTAYDGGDLLINRSTPIKPTRKQGSIIVFPACVYHKVEPVTRGERYSAVSWMSGPPFR